MNRAAHVRASFPTGGWNPARRVDSVPRSPRLGAVLDYQRQQAHLTNKVRRDLTSMRKHTGISTPRAAPVKGRRSTRKYEEPGQREQPSGVEDGLRPVQSLAWSATDWKAGSPAAGQKCCCLIEKRETRVPSAAAKSGLVRRVPLMLCGRSPTYFTVASKRSVGDLFPTEATFAETRR